ncbi:sigma-70 family RNA polymerase sigma factor [Streptomyces agglomeratus]|uniref:sigma-70 family RNA polymerase sigma factor n=1 Tax=Streptomyces agglomeratus TaxID=285458 RepID=UPI000B19CC30|nr:sigma-70 family RNA polymerase sigma factor [Streptomyces agglomeratus]
MKAALAVLLTRLRNAAADGAVSESVFLEQAGALGLGPVERERLREELAALGLPVPGLVAHADGDGPNAEKVALIREENVSSLVFPSRDVVRGLLSQYADPEGYVTLRALDGVTRLAGLGVRDAAAVRAGVRLRGEAVARAEAPATGTGTGTESVVRLTEVEAYPLEGVAEDEPFPRQEATTGAGTGDLTAAVAAALTVLENDRFRRRPDMRLLSAEAEVGLAVLVRGGPDRMAEEPDDDTLSVLPTDDLRVRARDCLVLHNQRLVHKMVPRYLEQGLDYDDLFQHGALGLMRAARKFDPAKGFKFSTYATWWVRQSISRGIADEGAVIRIPVHMHEQVRKVALAERTLAIQGRPAGVADVAVYCDLTMQKVEEARKLSRRTDSLDRVIGDGVTLGDFIGWTNPLPSVEKGVLDAILLDQIMSVVDTFSEREAHILVRRLGLDGDEPSTLDELGKQIGRTRERVRQIESKAKTQFRLRLAEAGLTAAYQYGGGLGTEPGRAERQPGGQRAGSGAGAGAGAPTESSGAKRVPDTLPGAAPKPASLEEVAQSAEAGKTLDAECLKERTVASPGDHTAPGDVLTDSATETPPEARIALTHEPGEQVDRRPEGRSDDPPPVTKQGLGPVVDAHDAESSIGLVHEPRTQPVLESAPEGSPSAQAVTVASGPSAPEPVIPEQTQDTADWQQALRMPTEFGGGVAWLADYALLAVGHAQLIALLGPSSADAVARAARDGGVLDRPVIAALEVLRRVFDAVKEAGLRPEDFLERPAEALVGMTPRAYLAARPLVLSESRLALRDSLREFVAEVPLRAGQRAAPADRSSASFVAESRPGPGPGPGSSGQMREVAVPDASASHGSTDAPTAQEQPVSLLKAGRGSASPRTPEMPRSGTANRRTGRGEAEPDAERRLTDLSRAFEAELTRERDKAQRNLAEERQAAEARRIVALAETERQLDALEDTLLRRADKALLRNEQRLRAQAEERIARLKDGHREAQQTLVERAEHAELRERAARTALAAAGERGAWAKERANDIEQHARTAMQRADDAELRANTAEEGAAVLHLRANEAQRRAENTGQQLRRYREEGEARIAGLEERLRQTEVLLAERHGALRAAQQQASAQVAAAEQRATARIAQTEHDAWARITDLQQQLAAERAAAADRSTFRDRWRRS